jgi:hypothetical protein
MPSFQFITCYAINEELLKLLLMAFNKNMVTKIISNDIQIYIFIDLTI